MIIEINSLIYNENITQNAVRKRVSLFLNKKYLKNNKILLTYLRNVKSNSERIKTGTTEVLNSPKNENRYCIKNIHKGKTES